MAVSSEFLSRNFKKYFKKEITVVGDSIFDSTALNARNSTINSDNLKFYNRWKLSAEIPILTLFTSVPFADISRDIQKQMVVNTFKIAENLNMQLVIKTHPLEDIIFYKRLHKHSNFPFTLIPDCRVSELCNISSLISVSLSTVAFEGMRCRVPVVCLLPTEALEPYETLEFGYLQNKGIVHLPPTVDPFPICRRLLVDDSYRNAQIEKGLKHAEEQTGPMDGRAPERLANWIKSSMAQGQSLDCN